MTFLIVSFFTNFRQKTEIKMQKLSVVILFILANFSAFSQGCSDAGACSVGALDLKSDDSPQLTLEYSQSIGLADKESLVFGSELGISQTLLPKTQIEVRIPYLITVGNLGSTSGVGDLLLTLTKGIYTTEKSSFSLVVGGRLNTNDANKKLDGDPLPMVYQSSLGTNDLILGLAWQSEKWSISAGWQHSFGNNLNEYLHPDSVELPKRKQYYESAYLDRGDDLMIRIQRTVKLNEENTIRFGFLPIYRMQEDQIKRNGVYEKLPGSSGITYNVFFNWDRKLSKSSVFNLSLGVPVHAREYRADGLTRTVIVSAGIRMRFTREDDDFYHGTRYID